MQNFVAFSEYINFNKQPDLKCKLLLNRIVEMQLRNILLIPFKKRSLPAYYKRFFFLNLEIVFIIFCNGTYGEELFYCCCCSNQVTQMLCQLWGWKAITCQKSQREILKCGSLFLFLPFFNWKPKSCACSLKKLLNYLW